MISIQVTADSSDVRNFIVRLEGLITRPKALNDALGRRLARELQTHFRVRNKIPNKLGGKKTNFWNEVSESTVLTDVSDTHATVSIGESRFRIHLEGGVIRPTGDRKALTIPLVADAHGLRVRDYEKSTGNKLFRIGGALFERSGAGDRSLLGRQRVTTRNKSGQSRTVAMRGRSQIRAVYALAKKVTIKKDPETLPDTDKILTALNETATQWLDREAKRGGLV